MKMRSRQPELATAYRLLSDWAEWTAKMLERSRLGYPSRTAEARLLEDGGVRSGRPPGSAVPLVDIPGRLLAVDRAMRDLPEGWRAAVYAEIFPANEGEPRRPEVLYQHRTGRSRSRFMRERDLALSWISSRLAGGAD